jgi:hypothetical protein
MLISVCAGDKAFLGKSAMLFGPHDLEVPVAKFRECLPPVSDERKARSPTALMLPSTSHHRRGRAAEMLFGERPDRN